MSSKRTNKQYSTEFKEEAVALIHDQGYSVQAWVRVSSCSKAHAGPARIFTISQNVSERNLTVAQNYSSLIVRLRTLFTTENGAPELIFYYIFVDQN